MQVHGKSYFIPSVSDDPEANYQTVVEVYEEAAKKASTKSLNLSQDNRYTIFLLPGIYKQPAKGKKLKIREHFIDIVGISDNAGNAVFLNESVDPLFEFVGEPHYCFMNFTIMGRQLPGNAFTAGAHHRNMVVKPTGRQYGYCVSEGAIAGRYERISAAVADGCSITMFSGKEARILVEGVEVSGKGTLTASFRNLVGSTIEDVRITTPVEGSFCSMLETNLENIKIDSKSVDAFKRYSGCNLTDIRVISAEDCRCFDSLATMRLGVEKQNVHSRCAAFSNKKLDAFGFDDSHDKFRGCSARSNGDLTAFGGRLSYADCEDCLAESTVGTRAFGGDVSGGRYVRCSARTTFGSVWAFGSLSSTGYYESTRSESKRDGADFSYGGAEKPGGYGDGGAYGASGSYRDVVKVGCILAPFTGKINRCDFTSDEPIPIIADARKGAQITYSTMMCGGGDSIQTRAEEPQGVMVVHCLIRGKLGPNLVNLSSNAQ